MAGRVRRLSEQRLLRSGVRALNMRALDGLRRVLGPDVLESASAEGGRPTVSRHSAYRLWPERDLAVVDVARHVLDIEEFSRKGVTSAIKVYDKAAQIHVGASQRASALGKDQRREVFRTVLQAYFDEQLRSEEHMAAWGFQVAAMTCSPLWEGSRPDAASLELGRQILEARAEFNEASMRGWDVLVWGSMALFGRRPRPGYTVRDIVLLMYCMFDGSFLRMFVDREIVHLGPRPRVHEEKLHRMISKVCDAMFEIAWACSEPGLLVDPRRPADPDDPRARSIEAIVNLATDRYKETDPGDVVDLVKVAREIGQKEELVRQIFPTHGDLADSVLRHLVGEGGEAGNWEVEDPAPWIESILQILSATATSHPAVVVATVRHRPVYPSTATYFIAELTQTITGLLDVSASLRSDDPSVEAGHLVELALQGESGWWGAKAVLERAAQRANAD